LSFVCMASRHLLSAGSTHTSAGSVYNRLPSVTCQRAQPISRQTLQLIARPGAARSNFRGSAFHWMHTSRVDWEDFSSSSHGSTFSCPLSSYIEPDFFMSFVTSYTVVTTRFPVVNRSDGKSQMMIPIPHCKYCAKPIKEEYEEWGVCYDCHKEPRVRDELPDRFFSVTLYIPDIRRGYDHNHEIIGLKERGEHSLVYAELLLNRLKDAGISTDEGTIVPIPPTAPRQGTTGPKALATSLSTLTNLQMNECLKFNRPVRSQKTLKKAEREANMRGSMTATTWGPGSRVFLVDDIVTTTLTMREGTRALRVAGATEVIGLAAARDAGIESLEYAGVVNRNEE